MTELPENRALLQNWQHFRTVKMPDAIAKYQQDGKNKIKLMPK
jgi:hypothetical protein